MTLINGLLVRTETDPSVIAQLQRKGWTQRPAAPSVQAGQEAVWENGAWLVRAVPPPPVPAEVPLWAFRAALALVGLKAAAEALIAALPEPDKTVATQQYEYGNFIERQHPLINGFGPQLGLTSAQIDDLFRTADSLR